MFSHPEIMPDFSTLETVKSPSYSNHFSPNFYPLDREKSHFLRVLAQPLRRNTPNDKRGEKDGAKECGETNGQENVALDIAYDYGWRTRAQANPRQFTPSWGCRFGYAVSNSTHFEQTLIKNIAYFF
jgi:hypothetical protein